MQVPKNIDNLSPEKMMDAIHSILEKRIEINKAELIETEQSYVDLEILNPGPHQFNLLHSIKVLDSIKKNNARALSKISKVSMEIKKLIILKTQLQDSSSQTIQDLLKKDQYRTLSPKQLIQKCKNQF